MLDSASPSAPLRAESNDITRFVAGDGGEVAITGWIDDPMLRPDAHEFVVGDVHGQIAALSRLLEAMVVEGETAGSLTSLGDLIHRGPDSLGCLTLFAGDLPGFTETNLLLGNHEVMLIRALRRSRQTFADWTFNGGNSLLDQFATRASTLKSLADDLALAIAGRVGHAGDLEMGRFRLARLLTAGTIRRTGNLCLVHAGIDPTVPIDNLAAWADPRRSIEEIWSRRSLPVLIDPGCLERDEPPACGLIVVHGHVPEHGWTARPAIGHHRRKGHRLGLDGFYGPGGAVVGAEIADGRYRIYRAAHGG